MTAPKSEVRVIEVHTITKPVWDMTGGEKRKYAQKDHPEFLINIIKEDDYLAEVKALKEASQAAEDRASIAENAMIQIARQNVKMHEHIASLKEDIEKLVKYYGDINKWQLGSNVQDLARQIATKYGIEV